MMGFDCVSFDKVLEKFGSMFYDFTPFTESGMIELIDSVGGCKRVVQAEDGLGPWAYLQSTK